MFGTKIISKWLRTEKRLSNRTYEIERHVSKCPKNSEYSIDTLTNYLIRPARNEHEKIQAIYSWITRNIAYDVQGFLSGNNMVVSAQDVLIYRSGVCEGYARLFTELAQCARLNAVRISGYAKGFGYSPGMKFNSTNHAWNAVQINRKWHLLDATWGAGYVNTRQKFVRRREDFYFLTPPQQFIHSHLPEKSRWQLLCRPVSLSQFENQVYLKPHFFKCGLGLINHTQSTIFVEGRTSIVLSAPSHVRILCVLRQRERELGDAFCNVKYLP